ncbi:MAG: hypothetical protein AMXMBFR84_10710 [Candidatus Hydrogenedentota bacterium]
MIASGIRRSVWLVLLGLSVLSPPDAFTEPESPETVPADSTATSPEPVAEADAKAESESAGQTPGRLSIEALASGELRVLDLNTAQRIALIENPSLQAAEARVRQGQARVKQARSLWYPTVTLSGSTSYTWLAENTYRSFRNQASDAYLRNFGLQTIGKLQADWLSAFAQGLAFLTGTGGAGQSPLAQQPIFNDFVATWLRAAQARRLVDDSFEDHRISIAANWIVFNGFDRKFANAEAKFGLHETEAAYDEAHRLLLDAVAQAYYAAQLFRENVAIAEADEEFNSRQLEEARARRRVGTGSLSDELNFEVRANAARSARIVQEEQYRTALIVLAELLALPESKFPSEMEVADLESESLQELNLPDTDESLELAKNYRPDLRLNEFSVKRFEAGIGRARSAYYPTVVAGVSKDAVRDENLHFGEEDFGTTVGVSVNYELFAGGRNVARVAEAKALRDEAERNLYQTELGVASEVRQAIEALKSAQELLVLQRANATFVQRNRDLVEKEYSAGVGSLVRLNEAQRDLIAAQANLASARVQLRQAWHSLRSATGETLRDRASALDESEAATADK